MHQACWRLPTLGCHGTQACTSAPSVQRAARAGKQPITPTTYQWARARAPRAAQTSRPRPMARKARAPSGASGADGVWRTISQLPQRAKTAIGAASTTISRRAKLIGSGLPQIAAGLRQRGQDLLEVADDAQMRLLEDRRLGICVDCDDRPLASAAGHVLHGVGDADREV